MASDRMKNRQTFSVEEASSILGISRNLGYSLARKNEFPGCFRLGKKRFVVSKEAIGKLLQKSNNKEV